MADARRKLWMQATSQIIIKSTATKVDDTVINYDTMKPQYVLATVDGDTVAINCHEAGCRLPTADSTME